MAEKKEPKSTEVDKTDHDLIRRINEKRFTLAKKRNKSISLRQVHVEIGIAHSTFFNVLYGHSKGGSAKSKINKWLKEAK